MCSSEQSASVCALGSTEWPNYNKQRLFVTASSNCLSSLSSPPLGRTDSAQHSRTATHAIVTELTRKTEGHGHKLYMDNSFSLPELPDDLAKKQI
jgi:hypothetical protein